MTKNNSDINAQSHETLRNNFEGYDGVDELSKYVSKRREMHVLVAWK